MKKIVLSFMIAIIAITMNAQQYNYAGSSKFTDNVSVTLQGGACTAFENMGDRTFPIIVGGIDKYFTPAIGLGVDGRMLFGTGINQYNTYTAVDAINFNGYIKVNVINAIDFNGTRRAFEPIVYTGFGWMHYTASKYNPGNSIVYRVGAELVYNVPNSNFGVVANPSGVWNRLDDGMNGYFEFTIGAIYHFKTSNSTNTFAKARLYNQNEIDMLNSKVNDLKSQLSNANKKISTLKSINHKPVTKTVVVYPKIQFEKGSSVITPTSMANIYDIAKMLKSENKEIIITGYASIEGTAEYNKNLSLERAEAVKKVFVENGIDPNMIQTIGSGGVDKFNQSILDLNRIVITEVK